MSAQATASWSRRATAGQCMPWLSTQMGLWQPLGVWMPMVRSSGMDLDELCIALCHDKHMPSSQEKLQRFIDITSSAVHPSPPERFNMRELKLLST